MRKLTEKTPPRRPAAFTLIELLVAIGIIAVLVGLLTPAIYGVMVRARITQVKADIAQIEGAIADFNLKFGMYPPSRITLYETQAGWNNDKRSRSIIRRLWPDFNFAKPRSFGVGMPSITLKGDQCLVFFLGGGWDGTKFTGFSADPTDPLQFSTATATRIGPFLDFDPNRIVINSSTLTYSAPLSRFPVYVDTMPAQTKPYLYVSSNEGLGYSPVFDSSRSPQYDTDVNTPASDPLIHLSTTDPPPPDAYHKVFKPYYLAPRTGSTDPAAWKPQTFQIISPGADGIYGLGGPYMPDQTNRLPFFDPANPPSPPYIRKGEHDNITNFSDGTLVP